MTTTPATAHGQLLHRPDSGPAFWGSGASYRFLLTGAESAREEQRNEKCR